MKSFDVKGSDQENMALLLQVAASKPVPSPAFKCKPAPPPPPQVRYIWQGDSSFWQELSLLKMSGAVGSEAFFTEHQAVGKSKLAPQPAVAFPAYSKNQLEETFRAVNIAPETFVKLRKSCAEKETLPPLPGPRLL